MRSRNLAFYSDIKVSLNRIAKGEYDGIVFVGNHLWKKDLEFGGGSYYLSLICDSTYRNVAFYIEKFEFNPMTTNRNVTLKEHRNSIFLSENTLQVVVKECVKRILRESYEDDSLFGWNWVYDVYKDNVDGETMKAIKKSYDKYGKECASRGETPNSVGFDLWMFRKDAASCEKGKGIRFPNYF